MLTFEQLTNLAKCSHQRMIRYNSKEELETFNMFAKGFPSIKPEAILWNFEEPPAIGIKVTISRALYDAIHEPVNSLIPNPDYTHLCRVKYRLERYHLPLIVFYIDFERSADLYSDWQWLKSQGSVHILEHYGIPSYHHNNWGCMFDWFKRCQGPSRELISFHSDWIFS